MSEENLTSFEQSSSSPSKEETVQQQAGHVCELALALFDHTASFHNLGENRRRLLGMAARLNYLRPQQLRTQGLRGKKKSIRSLRSLLQQQAMADYDSGELSGEEQAVMAALIAFQEGKIKPAKLARLNLSPVWQRDLPTLVALLRIALGLNCSRSQGTHIQRSEAAPETNEKWIVVNGPHAIYDAKAAQRQTKLWVSLGYPPLRMLEAGQAEQELAKYPPFPAPMQKAGIEPCDPMAEAGRKVMRFHFAEMLRHEEGTRQGKDIEALHDMRVATRRLRAAFEVFGPAFEPAVLKPHLKGLRAAGRALGEVRDLDVFMEKAQLYLDTLPEDARPGLDPLLHSWQAQRESARARMIAHLDSLAYRTFKREFNLFLSIPGVGARPLPAGDLPGEPVPEFVRDLAPVLVYNRLAAVRAFDRILEGARIEQLHALRIEFKKLRYTVEFFREVLGDEAKMVINDLKKIQDHLGDLNDADVATLILRQFLDEWDQAELPLEQRESPEAIVTYLAARHAERHRLLVTFRETWVKFNHPDFRRNLALAISSL